MTSTRDKNYSGHDIRIVEEGRLEEEETHQDFKTTRNERTWWISYREKFEQTKQIDREGITR